MVAVSDATGTSIATNTYDEYGKPGAANIGRFQYTGQRWLAELGLTDYKARMYAPNLGRFLQTDPIGYEGGANLYAYVGNDPVNLVDQLGLIGSVADVVNIKPNYDTNSLGDIIESPEGPEIVVTGELTHYECEACKSDDLPNEVFGLANLAGSGQERYGEAPGVQEARGAIPKAIIKVLSKITTKLTKPRIQWKFKTHSADRLKKAGINPQNAQSAVQNAITNSNRGQLLSGTLLRGQIQVEGRWIEYRAFVLPDGTISVGTIFPI